VTLSSLDTAPIRRLRGLALLLAGAAAACGGGPAADAIEREVFIATYVDLRIAAFHTDSSRVATAEKDEILTRHGVTEEDLTTFAEVHSADLEFMRDVWNEVEARLDQEGDDTGGAAPSPG
jgi:hypothetical protein